MWWMDRYAPAAVLSCNLFPIWVWQNYFVMVQQFLCLQDVEVCYFQVYIDGVDFVFIESPMFRHLEHNIYGGNRMVWYCFFNVWIEIWCIHNLHSLYIYFFHVITILLLSFITFWVLHVFGFPMLQDILKRMILFCKAAVEV